MLSGPYETISSRGINHGYLKARPSIEFRCNALSLVAISLYKGSRQECRLPGTARADLPILGICDAACATNALGSYLGYDAQTLGSIKLQVRGPAPFLSSHSACRTCLNAFCRPAWRVPDFLKSWAVLSSKTTSERH